MGNPRFLSMYDEGKAFGPSNHLTKTTSMMSTPYEFRAFTFGTVFALGDSFPFPNPIQSREAETGNSPFYAIVDAESKPRPSITLQTVPTIIETTLRKRSPARVRLRKPSKLGTRLVSCIGT